MLRYVQSILIVATLSIFVHPSLAADNQLLQQFFQTRLHSGAPTEKLVIVFNLNPIVKNDGVIQNCHTSFDLTARDAKGASDSFDIEDVDLVAGETQVVEIPFDQFSNGNGSSHAIVSISDLQRMGPCGVITSFRIADADTEETRASVAIDKWVYIIDINPNGSPGSGNPQSRALVSGASTENWELALVLNRNVNVNGQRQVMSAANCGFEATFTARDATGNSSFEISEEIALGAGEFQSKGFGFVEFASDDEDAAHVIVEISDVHQFGPCQVLSTARWIRGDGGTAAASGLFHINGRVRYGLSTFVGGE
jgi:hypothetical protein